MFVVHVFAVVPHFAVLSIVLYGRLMLLVIKTNSNSANDALLRLALMRLALMRLVRWCVSCVDASRALLRPCARALLQVEQNNC